MLSWLTSVHKLCREIRRQAIIALLASDEAEPDAARRAEARGAIGASIIALKALLPEDFPASRIGDLQRHHSFGDKQDFCDILRMDVSSVEEKAEEYAATKSHEPVNAGFEDLLHPIIERAALSQFQGGHYRIAVFEAMTAVFDLLRERTGLDGDGERLITQAFSVTTPRLIIGDLSTETGRNEQAGFMQLCQGAYKSIRNPKAHTRRHTIESGVAAQNIIFASLLARIISDADRAPVKEI